MSSVCRGLLRVPFAAAMAGIVGMACIGAGTGWCAPEDVVPKAATETVAVAVPVIEQRLADADIGGRAELIVQAAAAGEPRLEALLSMLEERRLLVDGGGRALVLLADGGVRDPTTGVRVPVDAGTLDSVTINNRVRGAIELARAVRKLGSAVAAERLAAARNFLDAEAPDLLPVIDDRLAAETDAAGRKVLGQVQASLRLASGDPALRMAAVVAFADSLDASVAARLAPLAAEATESDPRIRAAAARSIRAIEQRMGWFDRLGNLFSGVSLGSVLLLAALGLAITYGLLGVINMAHGEMLMLGAYATFVVQRLFAQHLPDAFGWYLLAALPVAFAVTALTGMLIERSVIRHLYGRPLETLLATWGISLLLIQVVRMLFGAQNVTVANPDWLSGGLELTTTLTLPYNRIAIILFVVLVLGFTWLLLQKTRLGLFVRAVTQNRRMADATGVPTGRVDMLAFGLGSGIAGLGGVALSQLGNVGPELGQSYIVDSFMVVVLGGVGQLAGTVLGALGLGVVNKILEPQVGAVLGKIAILVFIILFIQKRPQGLFALKGRQID